MAPIKFDEKLREKLEERTITPNEMTWERLDVKLDKLKKKKNNKPFWWLGLAASFIGVLLVSNLFFNSKNNSTRPVIVNAPNKTEITKETKKASPVYQVKDKPEIVVKNEANEIKEKTKTTINSTSVLTTQNQQRLVKTPKKDNISTAIKAAKFNKPILNKGLEAHSKLASATVNKKNNSNHFETQKINEVVAQIQELKANKSVVTNAEIDSLLNKATQAIFKARAKVETTRVVDANSLLSEVENELEQSFRERVFETIKSGYKTVRTAVVERKNN